MQQVYLKNPLCAILSMKMTRQIVDKIMITGHQILDTNKTNLLHREITIKIQRR